VVDALPGRLSPAERSMNATAKDRSGWLCQLSLQLPAEGLAMSRETLKCLLIAAAGLVLSFFTHNLARLTDCRTYARNDDPVSRANFLQNACPDPGPYAQQSSVFFYALLSPFTHTRSVGPEVSAAGNPPDKP
jgi:hypothetical protein